LNNATLNLTGSLTAAGADVVLIKNNGGSPVSGTFNGLPEGASVTVNGVNLVISYVGGAGHDVVLTTPADLSSTFSGGSLTIADTLGVNNNLPVSADGSPILVITGSLQQFLSAPGAGTLSNNKHTLTIAQATS